MRESLEIPRTLMEYSQTSPPPKKATARKITKKGQCGMLAKGCEEKMRGVFVRACVYRVGRPP